MPKAEHYNFVLHNISPTIVDHDITIFLEYNLRLIVQERTLDSGWPGEGLSDGWCEIQVACSYGLQLPAGSFAKGNDSPQHDCPLSSRVAALLLYPRRGSKTRPAPAVIG
jgi:hypothetical protein